MARSPLESQVLEQAKKLSDLFHRTGGDCMEYSDENVRIVALKQVHFNDIAPLLD